MAIDVPSSRVEQRASRFGWGSPILSGDGAISGVMERGIRGTSSEANHLYAYRGRVLYSVIESRSNSYFGTTSNVLVQATSDVDVTVAADFIEVTLIADVEDGAVALLVDGIASSATTLVGGRATHTLTVTVAAGARTIAVAMKKDPVASNAYLYRATVRETVLGAADFPSAPAPEPPTLTDEGMPSQYNTTWNLKSGSVDTIEVNPTDSELPAWVLTAKSDGTMRQSIIPSGGLECDISTTGLGGLRTGTEALEGYWVYVVDDGTTTDGSTTELICDTNAGVMSFAELAAVDAAYVYRSRVESFISNTVAATDASAGDILPFVQRDGVCEYTTYYQDANVIASHTTTTPKLIDASDFAPPCTQMGIAMKGVANNITDLNIKTVGNLQRRQMLRLDNVSGTSSNQWLEFAMHGSNPADLGYLVFNSTPSGYGVVAVLWWSI